MVAHGNILNRDDGNNRVWIGMLVLSALCHIVFISGVAFLPRWSSHEDYSPTTVEVDLVSLPAPSASPGNPAVSRPAEDVSTEEPPETIPVKKPTVLEKTQPRETPNQTPPSPQEEDAVSSETPLQVKRSVKKSTYNVPQVIDKAIADIKKEVPDSRPRSVLDAIERLEKEGHGEEREKGAGAVGTGSSGGPGKKTGELLDIYNAEIWHRIQKNWAFSEEMAQGQKGLESVIIMKIMRDGEIRDIWFEKRSGNAYFDDSVLKAIKKSNPLPPLPDGFLGPYYDVGVRFSPAELRGRR